MIYAASIPLGIDVSNNNPQKSQGSANFQAQFQFTQAHAMARAQAQSKVQAQLQAQIQAGMAMNQTQVFQQMRPPEAPGEVVAAILPESALYTQLLEFESWVDAALTRKKVDIQEALKNPPCIQKTLRIFVFNTFANQNSTIPGNPNADPPTWTLKIIGRIRTSQGLFRNQTHWVEDAVIRYLNRRPAAGNEGPGSWASGNSTPLSNLRASLISLTPREHKRCPV
ncbi:unnamed protein product [Thlaspi arvense]|uniref:Gag protein n=1 Tax=Thlaspi arvense TaxID=13288 RepID=A0AAU9STZ8_THLAR|nr:unnamed protein product [Thlaspi arvense]